MVHALIGATGFVGGALLSESVSHRFHSRNIAQIRGASFDTVYCAAAPGSMFEANSAPERDKARISALMDELSQVTARQFVLVSSIAVLANFAGKDAEDTTAFQSDLAYGRHRRALEVFCAENFDRCLILRLPALFGSGLKKNFLFDILNPVPTMLTPARMSAAHTALSHTCREMLQQVYEWDETLRLHKLDRAMLNTSPQRRMLENEIQSAGLSAIGFTHPASTYQFYNINNLPADIEGALSRGLDVLHLAVEPIQAAEIYQTVTGQHMPVSQASVHHEDMRSHHADIRGQTGHYLTNRVVVLEGLRRFFETERAAQ